MAAKVILYIFIIVWGGGTTHADGRENSGNTVVGVEILYA